MITILKIFLPIYFLLFFGLAMFWRSYIAWKRTGINPYKLGNGDTVHDFVGKLFRLTLIASALIVFVFSFMDQYYELLSPIAWMNSPVLVIIGIALLILALIWVLVAQIQMGDSWRIGVDPGERTQLVTNGVFGLVRNPIFSAMVLATIGLVLLVPNAVSVAALLALIVGLELQVRVVEEPYLREVHGDAYSRYLSAAGRFVPGVGVERP